ncbi:hypothetical protein BDZ91DRAFT_800159 [Kalaharituber pfeilii]|nr:hypothetical protein BDZ91DRAFT_800159 [Kalaharituber pfeilii]
MTENAFITPEGVYQESPFACNLHALAAIKSIQDLNSHNQKALNRSLGSTPVPEDVEKHLPLLDAISLLLVARPKSDVAAVGIVIGDNKIPALYYAKNAPCTNAEKKHIEAMVSFIQNPDNTNAEKAYRLFQLVLPFCKGKMQQRLQKLQKHLSANGWDGLDANELLVKVAETFKYSAEAAKFLDDSLSEIQGPKSFPDHVCNFLQTILKLDPCTMANDPEKLFDICYIASNIGDALCYGVGARCMDQTLQRRTSKFGDYFTSVALITLWGAQNTSIGHDRRKAFTMEEVPHIPPPARVRVPTDYLTILNLYMQNNSQEPGDRAPITRSALQAQFPTFNGLPETVPSYTSISVLRESIHCECSVAIHIRYLLQRRHSPNTRFVKIGVSKQSCLLCHEFLSALNSFESEHHNGSVFLTSGCHRKVPSTWGAPFGAPQDCIERVEKRVKLGLDSIIHLIRNRKRSDLAHLTPPNRRELNQYRRKRRKLGDGD